MKAIVLYSAQNSADDSAALNEADPSVVAGRLAQWASATNRYRGIFRLNVPNGRGTAVALSAGIMGTPRFRTLVRDALVGFSFGLVIALGVGWVAATPSETTTETQQQ